MKNFIFENWLLLGPVFYEIIARVWPTRWNISIFDNVWKIINLLIPNKRIPSGHERQIFSDSSGKDKNMISVFTNKHILKLILIFCLFSFGTKAQIWQNFKGVRLVNNSDTTKQLAIQGSVFYDDITDKFLFRDNIGWKSFQTLGTTIGGDMFLSKIQTSTGKKTFQPDATNGGINIGTIFGNPTTTVNGDIWLNTLDGSPKIKVSGTDRHIAYTSNQSVNGIPFFAGQGFNAQLSSDNKFVWRLGNVGIGTNNPNAPLQFENIGGRKIVFYDTNNNDHQLYGISFNVVDNLIQHRIGTNTLGSHVFYAGTSATTSNELMRIKGDGNVGIGTNNPNAPLQFANTVNLRKIVLRELFNNDHQFNGFGMTASGHTNYQAPSTTEDHIFYAGTSATTSNELMRIKGGGDITADNGAFNYISALNFLEIGEKTSASKSSGLFLYGTNSASAQHIGIIEAHILATRPTVSYRSNAADLRIAPATGNFLLLHNIPTANPCATAPSGTVWSNVNILTICP